VETTSGTIPSDAKTMNKKATEQTRIALAYQTNTIKDSKKRQSRDGVVVTPINVVDFQIKSAIHSIKLKYNVDPDEVEWLDPFGGTGIYIARLMQLANLTPERKLILAKKCIVLEISLDACQIAANNLSIVHLQETGYQGCIRVLCLDTFSQPPDTDFFNHNYDKFMIKPKFPHSLFNTM
jgi:predicted helicase